MFKKLMPLVIICFATFHSQANAYYQKERSSDKLVVEIIDNYAYMAHIKDQKLSLLNAHGINWFSLESGMRTAPFKARLALGIPYHILQTAVIVAGAASFPALGLPAALVPFAIHPITAIIGMSGLYLSHSVLACVLFAEDDTQFSQTSIFFPGLGVDELEIRLRRAQELLKPEAFFINEARFNKILELVPRIVGPDDRPNKLEYFKKYM